MELTFCVDSELDEPFPDELGRLPSAQEGSLVGDGRTATEDTCFRKCFKGSSHDLAAILLPKISSSSSLLRIIAFSEELGVFVADVFCGGAVDL